MLLPGDVVDLDGLYQERLGFGVMAVTDCQTTSIPLTTIRSLIDERPSVRDFLWSSMVNENAALIETIESNGRRSPRQGIAHLLSDLLLRLEIVGEVRDGSFRFEMRQADMSDFLGLSIVHINRTMQSLKGQGLIGASGRYLPRTRPQGPETDRRV